VSAVTRATDDAGPEAQAALRDDLDRVAQAMSELTDDQREVIELRFFAGLSVLETAVAMGRQEGTVRGLQFRAIAALRRTLGLEPEAPTPARSTSSASKVAAATINVLR
jgi:RNA polymerase sigma-70 factor (ECF subfamily)